MDTPGASAFASAPPLRVLSLDGGGIRGKSSLLILENIMETIRQAKNLESVPKPCEYFNLIGGTSTGGIIAIMLGRLGMTVDECIRAYDTVAQTAFTPKRTSFIPGPPKGAYSAQALEGAIKQTVKKFCVESPCIEQRRQGQSTVESCPHEDAEFRKTSCTKTVVLAITKDNVDAGPTLFTTYDTSASYQGCTIWQVVRATSAATTFFKSIKIGRDSVEFIDAGFGHNNPCEVLIEEARKQFPRRGTLQVLSIGTGLGPIVEIKNSRRSIIKALAKMAATSTAVATRLNGQYGDSGQYYRFNVDRGLDDITLADWEKTSTIAAHTGNYLRENQRTIQKFVDNFVNNPQGLGATVPHDATASSQAPYYIPLHKNKHFVGRAETLRLLNQQLFNGGNHKRVCLHGLGGIGKTQVALRIAYTAKDTLGLLVIWLPAANSATFQQVCTEAVNLLAIPAAKDEDRREALQRYLNSRTTRKWLLVVDNIDEMNTLLGSLDESGVQLTHLPLAITQAAAYLTRNKVSVREYLDLLRTTESNKAELMSWEFYDKDRYEGSQNAVALTWQVSFKQICDIDTTAAHLLRFISRIEPKAIPRSMLPQKGSEVQFRNTIGTLIGYAFLDIREGRDTYDMHSLVHTATRTWVDTEGHEMTAIADAVEHLSTVFPTDKWENRHVWRQYLPHALRALQEDNMRSKDSTELGFWVGRCLMEDGQHKDAIPILKHVLSTQETALAEDHPDRLASQHVLAIAYQSNGQVPEAVELLEHVVSIRKTLAEDHPSRLASQYALAAAYQANGQVPEAVELLEHVISIRKTLAENHPSRLTSQHALAIAYQADGQVPEAVELLEHVVSICKISLAENHPDRLLSQYRLAEAYRQLQRLNLKKYSRRWAAAYKQHNNLNRARTKLRVRRISLIYNKIPF
ncbi:hypothetical protein GQX73_g4720 [Xylaria multiplex]|uniref:PNPLA domain-containing protein n=1 Tax=Xylaria multiplex TaxID=323545 RepID=A0A7C8MV73_9PEZI|nr:hypothetical protein GQX73_g4720 [Xylaria multiplex]